MIQTDKIIFAKTIADNGHPYRYLHWAVGRPASVVHSIDLQRFRAHCVLCGFVVLTNTELPCKSPDTMDTTANVSHREDANCPLRAHFILSFHSQHFTWGVNQILRDKAMAVQWTIRQLLCSHINKPPRFVYLCIWEHMRGECLETPWASVWFDHHAGTLSLQVKTSGSHFSNQATDGLHRTCCCKPWQVKQTVMLI